MSIKIDEMNETAKQYNARISKFEAIGEESSLINEDWIPKSSKFDKIKSMKEFVE